MLEEVRACLDNDLDTPNALLVIDECSKAGFRPVEATSLLGVTL